MNREIENERFKVEPVIEKTLQKDIFVNSASTSSSERVYNTVGAEYYNDNIQKQSFKREKSVDSTKSEELTNRKMRNYQRKISFISNNKQSNSRNGNMVLQLVLSPDAINREENNYLTSSSLSNSESTSSNLIKYRERSRMASENGIHQDAMEPIATPMYINRTFSTSDADLIDRLALRNPGRQFCRKNEDVEKMANENCPESTSDENKQRMFRKFLTIILSCIYAMFIVTLGLVVYISDIIIGSSALAETFSIYLLIIGFVYMIYLVVDIRIYVNKMADRSRDNGRSNLSGIECRESHEGDLHLSVPIPSWSEIQEEGLPNRYCFSKGRHSGSFYLKVGAAGFCLGHLIHSGLLLGYQIVFLTSEGDAFYECASVATLVLDIIYPIYSFFLLYVLFKYSNVIINARQELGRFALMHCIASSLCFWIWTILRETTDSLSHGNKDNNSNDNDDTSSEENSAEINFYETNSPLALALTSYGKIGAKQLVNFFNETTRPRIGTICMNDARLEVIYNYYSPYLYPFTVEYNILLVGVLYIIWKNIGKCYKTQHSTCAAKQCPTPGLNEENGYKSNLVIHVDCHSTNTGLFCGILVIVSAVVSVILFFIAISDQENIYLGVIVNTVTKLALLVLMTISAILAYMQIKKLDINCHPVSLLDDLLLFISIPAFFLYAIFSIIPAVDVVDGIGLAVILIEVLQVLIQTPLIIDGLRRCSNTNDLHVKKPGRGLIIFLVICNIAIWIIETFEIKTEDLQDARYDFYGKVWWTILSHMTLPLTMFYRFHSSVCLVDIWKSAYEPGE